MVELRESPVRDTGTRYPDETKELAYQLWAFLAGRNASEVSRMLATEEHGAVTVPRETVAYWAREYGWAARVDRELESIAPDLRRQAFSELLIAGHEATRYLREVMRGMHDSPAIDDIVQDMDLAPADKRMRIDARIRAHDAARKARLQAAIAVKDSIGFSPVGKGAPTLEPPSAAVEPIPLDDLTGKPPEELMRLETAFRARKR